MPATVSRSRRRKWLGLFLSLLLGIVAPARAEDNTTNVISGFGFDMGNTDLVIGSSGTNNYGQIDSAGSVFNVADTYIGLGSVADFNAILVTDLGSTLLVNNQYYVGFSGSFNNLTIANGGVATGGGLFNFIGNSATSTGNSVSVTGPGSVWSLAGGVGSGGTSNTLTISGGGVVTNTLGLVGTDATSSDNGVLVTGSGSVWANTELQLGVKGTGNTVTVAAGAQVWSVGSALTGRIGAHTDGTSGNNTVVVTGAGSLWQNDGQLFVGEYGSSNSIIITDGGTVAAPRPIVGAGATGFPSPDYNTVVVSGAGSAFVQTNTSGLPTGNARIGSVGSFNRLIVTNRGFVHFTFSDSRISSSATSSNNSGLVSGAGSLWKNDGELAVGRGGPGNNSLIIADGGVVESVCGSIGSANCNDNTVAITGGGSAWDLQGCDLTVPRGSVTSSTNNLLTVADNGWLTNVTTVSVIGLGSAIHLDNGHIAASDVVLETNSTLSGRGTINGALTANAGAIVQPGLGGGDTSALTIDGTCSLAGTTLITLNRANSPSASKLAVSGALTAGGTLTVANAGDTLQAGDTFSLYSAASVSGGFSETNLPALGPGLQWVFDPASGTLTVEGPPALQFSLSGNTLALAWPPANLGWIAQSNSVSLADAGSWFDIANSETDTNLSIVIDPALTNLFFRLRLP